MGSNNLSDIAIRVESLGKRYRTGKAQQRNDTLRLYAVQMLRIADWRRRSLMWCEESAEFNEQGD